MPEVTLKVRTPTRSWQLKDTLELKEVLTEEINKNVAKVALTKLSEIEDAAIRQQILIWATFFQRVVARTPLDEDYYYIDRSGPSPVKRFHKADQVQCRYDWYITDGKQKVTAKELYEQDNNIFDYVSDASAIAKISDVFASTLHFNATNQRMYIYNKNPHFTVLEYGGGHHWGKDSEVKVGPTGLEHGVKNNHSVQQPVGMLRITEAELSRSAGNLKAKTALSQRFKGQAVKKYKDGSTRARRSTPTDYQLTQICKALERGGIKFDDIQRFIGER